MPVANSLYEFGVFSLLYLITTVAAIVFAGYLAVKYRSREGRILSILFLAVGLWAGANMFEVAATTVNLKQTWAAISYIGTGLSPFFFFLYCMQYANRIHKKNFKYLISLSAVPVLFIFIAGTNYLHKSLWTQIQIDPATNLGIYSHGWLFWSFIIYQYILLTTGFIFLIISAVHQNRIINGQLIILLLGSVFPIVGNLTYVFKLTPPAGFDWTPVSFCICSFLLTIGIRKYQLFDVVPIARGHLIETMSIGYAVTDQDLRIRDYNPAMINILGIHADTSLSGNFLADYLRESTGSDLVTFLLDPALSEMPVEISIGTRYVEIMNKPLLTESGKLNGRLIIFRDTTQRKEAEQAIEGYAEHLATENREKELLIQELDAYAHTVAHDLKNPLGSVLGFLELMNRDVEGSKKKDLIKYHALASRAANNLMHIIDELLLMATIRKENIGAELLDMKAIIDRVLIRLDHLQRQSSAVITLPDYWPQAVGYSPWIEEVWANFISNAIKYGGNPPRITLGWHIMQPGYYRFWIEDNGSGIPPEKQQQLFKSSPSLDHDDNEVHGLGLSIVKRIINKLGGKAGFEQQPGHPEKGRFYFTLPEANGKKVSRG